MRQPPPERPKWLPELDLRAVTRNSNRAETRISVVLAHETIPWIRCGLLSRFALDPGRQWLGAYFDHGITDMSEDSAYAFHIDVVGAHLDSIEYGTTRLRAWIASRPEDVENFHVPAEPFDLSKLDWCPHCEGKDRHQVTDYTPPPHAALWQKLRGVEIVIQLAAVIPEDER